MVRTIFAVFLSGFCLQPAAFAQTTLNPDSGFDSIFTPFVEVQDSVCSTAIIRDQGAVSSLTDQQFDLFRQAFAAVAATDDESLRNLVTNPDNYLDLYPFINQLRSLVQDPSGIKFMYKVSFDPDIALHNELARLFQDSPPDVIVNIAWCQVAPDGSGIQQTGGFAYLSTHDGRWQFHAR